MSSTLTRQQCPKWEDLKGAKKEKRVSSTGFEYNYAEGAMIFPDPDLTVSQAER